MKSIFRVALVFLASVLVACSSKVSSVGNETEISRNSFRISGTDCETIDANLSQKNWHEFIDEYAGYSLKYPGFVFESRHGSARIENYRCGGDSFGLQPDWYYLEIGYAYGEKCEQSSSQKIVLQSGIEAWYEFTPEKKAHEAGGNRFSYCIDADGTRINFSFTETSDSGFFANKIMNTVQLPTK